jgi:hypothetical protein
MYNADHSLGTDRNEVVSLYQNVVQAKIMSEIGRHSISMFCIKAVEVTEKWRIV